MRRFSEIEKKAMALIASQNFESYEQQDMIKLLSSLLLLSNIRLGVKPHVERSETGLVTYYCQSNQDLFKALEQTASYISLVSFLEEEHYIFCFRDFQSKTAEMQHDFKTRGKYELPLKPSNELGNFILDNWGKKVLPAEALRELVKNSYKTGEDLLMESQLGIADKQLDIASKQLDKSSSQIWWAIATLIATVIVQAIAVVITKWC